MDDAFLLSTGVKRFSNWKLGTTCMECSSWPTHTIYGRPYCQACALRAVEGHAPVRTIAHAEAEALFPEKTPV